MIHSKPSLSLVAAALLLASAPAFAQTPTWTHQAPIPTGETLSDVFMVSATEAWAASDGGISGIGHLVHTKDAGQTWETIELGGGASLWSVFFVDSQRGWAAGNGFFHTTDGGATWSNDSIGGMGSVSDLYFLDAQHGWAVGNGGQTFRTIDGGVTWNIHPLGNIYTLGSIFFLDQDNGWTGNVKGEVYSTTDGGQSWTLRTTLPSFVGTIQFVGPLEGWAIGGNNFWHTIDGGATWQQVSVPTGTWAGRAYFLDRNLGWVAGAGGEAVRTTDGGATWQVMPRYGNVGQLSVHFADAQTGMIVGDTGLFLMSTDGGVSWSPLQSGGDGTTYSLDAVDADHAWAGNDGGEILLTTNGGKLWERVPVAGFDSFGELLDVDFIDHTTGWAVGDQPGFAVATSGRVVRSLDGGRTWEVKLMANNVYMSAVEAIDSQRAFAFGWIPFCCDFLWRTLDGGQSWQNVSPGGAVDAIEFIDADTGWIAGGWIQKTTDGGSTWTPQLSPQYYISDLSFADANNGWAVGGFGTLLHTTDGGANWNPQSLGTGNSINFLEVEALSATTAWISGGNGFVARTTDGGQTWTQEVVSPAINHYFTAMHFLDANTGWIGTQAIPPAGGIWFREDPSGCPVPATYCTAKLNSCSQVPTIGHAGVASASASSGFTISATGARANRSGLLLYTNAGAANPATPFQGGLLCLNTAPLRRGPAVNSGGVAGCDGTFALDMNAFASGNAGGNPAPFLSVPGTRIDCQWWGRDTVAHGSFLSDGIEYTVCP